VRLYLRPTKNVQNLNPFLGIYPIGDFRTLRNNQFLKILPSKEFINEIEQQLPPNNSYLVSQSGEKKQSSEDGGNENSTEGRADSTISVTNLEFDSPARSVLSLNHKRTIIYPVNICFINNPT
jgi:hypothetical protein